MMATIDSPAKVACPYCNASGIEHNAPCKECGGTGQFAPTVWFFVGDLLNPAAEPFAILRVDVSKRVGDGVEAIVDSLHWSREVAEQIAADLNSKFHQEIGHA